MIKLKLTYLLTTAILAITGCSSKSNQELLVGYWDCKSSDGEYEGSGTVEYDSNGTFNQTIEILLAEESDGKYFIDATVNGTWEVNGTKLLQRTETQTMALRKGDKQAPPETTQGDDVKDPVSEGEIIQLDDQILITTLGDSEVNCSRTIR